MQDVFKDGNSQFLNNPKAIDDIGNTAFLKLPFYKRKNKVNVIYINPEIYERIFRKKYDYEVAKKDIIDRFSVTLKNDNNNDDILGYGYVDRQGDPTDIALNGNKGSGRAFYLYENCNLKGEKTPFATSPRDDYNNGKYSLDCAIQECLISNVLNNTLGFDNFETLAIIDLNEEFLFPHTEGKLPCGLIIRYYENNELYRFSHRFINNKNFSKEKLYTIAKKIGILEGNKFIKRFLHGAWSIGNLSIDGNMIDLDTSFFVKGRHPQWSFTDKYITNYFGFEQKGQLKVLETVLNCDLNVDNVSLDELDLIVEDNRKKTIRKEFAFLIGYDEEIYNKYANYFDKLADEFSFLSQIIYDNYDNLNCLDENCQNTYLFDFSNFFRYYEITKQNGTWSKMKGLSLLLNKDAKCLEYLYNDDNYHHKIKHFFSNIIADSTDRYMEFINRALQFIEKFSLINEFIDTNESINKNKKLIQAYIENEDKKYLMARKWMRAELIDFYKENGSKIVNEIINTIIYFYSNKNSSGNKVSSDLYIFEKGYIYHDIYTNGYNYYCLKMFDKQNIDKIIMKVNDCNILLTSSDYINYFSESFYNTKLSELSDIYLKIGDKIMHTTELGRDNPKNKHIEYIFTDNDNIDISKEDIRILLKENYSINALNIDQVTGGTTKCYCVNDGNKKYFLKEFEIGKSVKSLIQEFKILETLKNNRFLIANFIKTDNNKLALKFKEHLIILEDFIDGMTYQTEKLPKELLFKSASLLGEIHNILADEFCSDSRNNLWNYLNIDREKKEINYLIKELEKIKDDTNYMILKETLDYKKSMLIKIKKYSDMFNSLTLCMTHGDYSKRQLIFNEDNIPIVVDFSSSIVAPVVWEIIRSYFLSTLSCKEGENFNYDLFINYVNSYMKSFNLSKDDLLTMPYTLLYQMILSKYGYLEYISGYNKDEVSFIKWKYNICKFLEENADIMSKRLIKCCIVK